ncbi:MAG: FAD-dependent monooxygenase [Myxococcota bacterium]|nr:FAD-dependent monooxygenase [Myxococcota bacterium]
MQSRFDVVVVGASIAGSTAAVLYARAGLKVALVERSTDASAYKKVCTHYIQACGTPVLQRLGVTGAMEEAGAVRNSLRIHTRYGWSRTELADGADGPRHGYSIRREKLDPMLRALAGSEPNVDLLLGHSVRALVVGAEGRVVGAELAAKDRGTVRIEARLVVGADGRNSKVAELGGFKTETLPHNRFGYMAYFKNLPLQSGNEAQFWIQEPDCAYAFPNDDGLTLIACFVHKARLAEFKADPEGSFRRLFAQFPESPVLSCGERVSDYFGMIDMPNLYRRPDGRGVTLVGDAALASDPMWGVGCGWALASAEWLVDATVPALQGKGDLQAGLVAYRKRHHRTLYPLHATNAAYSTGEPMDAGRRLLFSATPYGRPLGSLVAQQLSLSVSNGGFLARAIPRALWVHFKRALGMSRPVLPETGTRTLAA